MIRVAVPCLSLLCLVPVACQPAAGNFDRNRPVPSAAVEPKAGAKPEPPLNIPTPDAELPRDGEKILETMDVNQLRNGARDFSREGQPAMAVRYQYWYCQRTNDKRYDLACYYAQTGNNTAAFYWLQVAALEDGIDPDWAEEDEDLTPLRRDGRWVSVAPFLRDCAGYWASGGKARTTLVVPEGYKPEEPIGVVVWLHASGSTPEDFINDRLCKDLATKAKVAMVGVSGTLAKGKSRFVWAGDLEKDYQRVQAALKEVSDRVKVKPGGLIAMGFSQGAQIALDMAVRHPDEFAGAIAISPTERSYLDAVSPPPAQLAKRGFVVTCGALERSENVNQANDATGWLHRAKAKVLHKTYAGVNQHRIPADFNQRFHAWIKFIDQANKETEKQANKS